MKKYIFFRNDDVRSNLDKSLIRITEICLENSVPICHAVEPGNISQEVVSWLVDLKKSYPELIEIIQHGYSHKLNYDRNINGRRKKGEFGGDRSYEAQLIDIKKGKEKMDEYFNGDWFRLFTFPFGGRNKDSIKALDNLNYLVVNGSMLPSFKFRAFSMIGRLFNLEMLFNRKVSWNLRYKPKTGIFQIDTGISIINKFINQDTECIFEDINNIKVLIDSHLKVYNTLGIVLHHRYHTNEESFRLIKEIINHIKENYFCEFLTQEKIYNHFGRK